MVYKELWRNMQPIKTRNTWVKPLLFFSTGFCYVCYTADGPTALLPIQRTRQCLSVLLKDTSVTIGTRTHTLLNRNTRV